jgi:glycosyltransferase involved in cell wall biosynthesis
MNAIAKGRRIKVLVIIPVLDVGGAEMDLVRNVPLLDRSIYDVAVCTLVGRGALATQLIEAGIDVLGPFDPHHQDRPVKTASRAGPVLGGISAGLARVGAFRNRVRTAIALARLVRCRKVDIVHAVLPISYLIGTMACALAPRRALVMSRLSQNWYQRKGFGFVERRLLHPFVDAAICNSKIIQEELLVEGIPATKLRLIPNGIDAKAFALQAGDRQTARQQLGLAQDALVLSVVANLYAYKGHVDLLAALQGVRDRLPPNWTLLAAGRDIKGRLEELRTLADRLGVAPHIRFLGERSDIARIMCAADIHVSASHTEGLPNNILEAMSVGRPLIATAVGGVSEIVVHGHTGLLVPAHDPAAIGAALLDLAFDPRRRAEMGAAARKLVASTFKVERSASALADVYRSVVRIT